MLWGRSTEILVLTKRPEIRYRLKTCFLLTLSILVLPVNTYANPLSSTQIIERSLGEALGRGDISAAVAARNQLRSISAGSSAVQLQILIPSLPSSSRSSQLSQSQQLERKIGEALSSGDVSAAAQGVQQLRTLASSGTPSSGTPSSGTPSSGTPSSGTPSSGTPSSGTPSSGTPSSGTPRFTGELPTFSMSVDETITYLKSNISDPVELVEALQSEDYKRMRVGDFSGSRKINTEISALEDKLPSIGNCISFIGQLEDCREADRSYEYYWLAIKRAADYPSDNLSRWCAYAKPSAIKRSEILVDSIKLKLNKLVSDSYDKELEWINRVKQESKRINSNLESNIRDSKRYHCLTDKNNVSSIDKLRFEIDNTITTSKIAIQSQDATASILTKESENQRIIPKSKRKFTLCSNSEKVEQIKGLNAKCPKGYKKVNL